MRATFEIDQRLVLYTVEVDSTIARVLALLASGAEEKPAAAPG